MTGEQKHAAIVEELKSRKLQTFGTVVDHNGQPIPDADVLIYWEPYAVGLVDNSHREWLKSDERGEWSVAHTAMRMYAKEARAPGYVMMREQDDSFVKQGGDRNITSPTNRMFIRLYRSKGATLLINQDRDLVFAKSNEPAFAKIDLLQPRVKKLTAKSNTVDGLYYDFEIKVSPAGTNGSWVLEVFTPHEFDGLWAAGTHSFEAPEYGYTNRCRFEGASPSAFPKYLYFKTRSPGIFSFIDLYCSPGPNSFLVAGKILINPFGERILEDYNFGDAWKLRKQLKKEAIDTLLQGKLPGKPDFPELIRKFHQNSEHSAGTP